MVTSRNTATAAAGAGAAAAAGTVLLTLSAAQFLMTLDSSVMNVSIAQVANDLGTTVTGIQTAITLYTLVMATLMITGGKIGSILGRRRVFAIGCIIYAAGSLTTALAPNLTVLMLGWSLLEGIGAALIMPAIVALVAGNFPPEGRARAYGLIASAGAIAVAVGPLIGGLVTTYFSWRWVFAAEVLIVLVILVLARKIADAPSDHRPKLDFVGTLLSVAGLGAFVYGVLQTSQWGWLQPKPGGPAILGMSPSLWLMMMGLFIMWLFLRWEGYLLRRQREPLVDPALLRNEQLNGGLVMFFFQFLLQAGVFFTVPLFLSVVLELSALQTGVRLVPLSLALLVAAAGIPRVWPSVSPRRVVRIGVLLLIAGILALMSGIDINADAAVVAIPMLLMGLGIGALASQLGAVAVSAVPQEQSGEVGGLQNTATNLGASLGTALAGSVLIAALTTTFLAGITNNPAVPPSVAEQATVELSSGVPFVSDSSLEASLAASGASPEVTSAAMEANVSARITGLDTALGVLGIIGLVALFFTGRIPDTQPGAEGGA